MPIDTGRRGASARSFHILPAGLVYRAQFLDPHYLPAGNLVTLRRLSRVLYLCFFLLTRAFLGLLMTIMFGNYSHDYEISFPIYASRICTDYQQTCSAGKPLQHLDFWANVRRYIPIHQMHGNASTRASVYPPPGGIPSLPLPSLEALTPSHGHKKAPLLYGGGGAAREKEMGRTKCTPIF